MLDYFRLNDPYRFIGLLIVLVILYVPFLADLPPLTLPELKSMLVGQRMLNGFSLYTQTIDQTEPLTGWIYAFANFFFGDGLLGRRILALVIIIFLTIMLGIIFIDKKVFPESSFIPPLMFGILAAFSFDTITLSGELFGTIFLLLALNSLFREIESREEQFEFVLKTGLFIGIATLFAFSFIVYVVATLVILIITTRTSGRKLLLMLIGFLVPHLILIGIYEINGGAPELFKYYYLPNLGFDKIRYVGTGHILLLMSVPLFFLGAALLVLHSESRFTKYQSQVLQAFFFWTIFSLLQVHYANEFRPHSFIPVLIGFTFFISHFFSIVIRRRFAEIAFWLFLGGIVATSYGSRYQWLNRGAYSKLFATEDEGIIKGKRIVILDDDLSLYRENTAATPFINWNLSKEIFAEPEYYQNINDVYTGFKEDLPEIIVDPNGLMKPFLDRIPELRRKYSRIPLGYQLNNQVSSN